MRSHSVRSLVLTWFGLLGLLALTLGSAFVPLGWGNALINLAIATGKALLVMAIFMHLATGNRVTRLAAAAGFFWLALLFGLGLTDFVARYF